MSLTVYKRYDVKSLDKYNPRKYFWPIFSLKNYKQRLEYVEDGQDENLGGVWFHYVKNKRRKRKEVFVDNEHVIQEESFEPTVVENKVIIVK